MRDAEPACSRYRLGTPLRGMPSMIQLLTLGGVVSATIGVLLLLFSHSIADGTDARRRPPIRPTSEAALTSALPAVRRGSAPDGGSSYRGQTSPAVVCAAQAGAFSARSLRTGATDT